MAEDTTTTTGNPLLDIITTVGNEAQSNPAPNSAPLPGHGSPKISPPKGTIKVPLSKYISGKK